MMQTSSDRGQSVWIWAAAVLAIFGLLLWWVLAPEWRPWPGEPRQPVQIGDETYVLNAREWQGARAIVLRALNDAEAEALAAFETELDERLDQLFALPRTQVETAADWYFSVHGQVVRAGSAIGADVGSRLIERLFPPEPWNTQQADLLDALTGSADSHLRRTGDVMLSSFHRQLREQRRAAEPAATVPAFAFDFSHNAFVEQLRQDPALERQALALATGTLSALAARRAAQAAAARGAGRQVGAGLSAACISAGLAAWICAGGVFGITLATTELVLIRVDEVQNREAFEAALLEELDRIQAEFAAVLQQSYVTTLTESFESRQQAMQHTLRPVDVLFGLPPENPQD